ncbi:MAG: pilus assembly protein PilM, partial [Phycisphaerae bacterium]|nr:pilus assembly protein PilM [Phycisphaerae bacterium]
FDPEPFALLRAMGQIFRRSADRAVPHAVVKISQFHTLIVIVQNGRILSVRSIDRGGANLGQAAAEHLGLSFEDAQRLRQNCMAIAAGGGNASLSSDAGSWQDSVSWALHDAVRTEAEEFTLQIELALRYCSTTFGCPKIQAVTLAGTDAWDPSLRILLAKRLGREPEGYSPLRGVDVSRCSLFADRRGILTGWTTCMGLALAGESPRRADQAIVLPREASMGVTGGGTL